MLRIYNINNITRWQSGSNPYMQVTQTYN